jgi:hypothetical protein
VADEFDLEVTDADGHSEVASYEITIAAAPSPWSS